METSLKAKWRTVSQVFSKLVVAITRLCVYHALLALLCVDMHLSDRRQVVRIISELSDPLPVV